MADLVVRTYDDDDMIPDAGANLTMQDYVAVNNDPTCRKGWRLVSETVPGVLVVADGQCIRRYILQNVVRFDVVTPPPRAVE